MLRAQTRKMVKDKGLSLLEYALNFVLNTKEIDKVLVGVNSIKQLQEIINAQNTKAQNLTPYNVDDVELLNPNLWKI